MCMNMEVWEIPLYMVVKAHDPQLLSSFHLPFWNCTTSRSCFTMVLVLACPFSHVPLQAECVVGSGRSQISLQGDHHNWVESPYLHQLALKGFEWCCDTNSHHFLLCSNTSTFPSASTPPIFLKPWSPSFCSLPCKIHSLDRQAVPANLSLHYYAGSGSIIFSHFSPLCFFLLVLFQFLVLCFKAKYVTKYKNKESILPFLFLYLMACFTQLCNQWHLKMKASFLFYWLY